MCPVALLQNAAVFADVFRPSAKHAKPHQPVLLQLRVLGAIVTKLNSGVQMQVLSVLRMERSLACLSHSNMAAVL